MEDSLDWLIHEATPPSGVPDPELLRLLMIREDLFEFGARGGTAYEDPDNHDLHAMNDVAAAILLRQSELEIDPLSDEPPPPTSDEGE